jgi:murein DD-endopeptidase MepM/ murein hydrolase activator NlpD
LPVKPTPAPAKPIVVASAVPGTPVTAPVPAAAAPQQPAQAGVHTVAAGDTLAKISKKHHKPLMAILKANNLPPNARLKIGDRIVIPGAQASLAVKEVGKDAAKDMQPKAPAAASAPAAAPAGAPGSKTPAKQASAEPAQTAAVVTPVNEPMPVAAHGKDGSTATFRWPVKGRVIAGFGPRPNGQQNDGINLAVPEGTPVKAAEDGVVTYAGSELKGYGNLVLVRHPNGYVTAYAHAKELLVKRGDSIKRGQTIANSGQTGNVDAPQLHFEIRKGPAPQDPLPMLAGG